VIALVFFAYHDRPEVRVVLKLVMLELVILKLEIPGRLVVMGIHIWHVFYKLGRKQ